MGNAKRKHEIMVRETNKAKDKQVLPNRDKSKDEVIRLDIKSKQNGKSTETKNNQ